MKLAEIQRQFYALAAGEQGDASAFVAGTPELGAQERVQIYANMFVWRQIDALRDDFTLLAEQLGDHGFYSFAEKYLREHPSTHASLSELGAHMPEFVRRERPELFDAALLDWTRAKVFEEPDVPYLERLPPMSEDDLPLATLRFVPAVRVIGGTVVWKKDFEVFHAQIEPAEARALSLAMEGHPLGVVCDVFDSVEAAFRAISSWFAEGFIREAA